MTPVETLSVMDNWDIVGKGMASIATAIAFGVAVFLRQKFLEKKEPKSDDTPMKEWLGEFLKAMTDDRREMAAMWKGMAQEIRDIGETQMRMAQHMEGSVTPSLSRIESKADALLQRRS